MRTLLCSKNLTMLCVRTPSCCENLAVREKILLSGESESLAVL